VTTPIWLLSTRGRPHAAQEVLDACEATGMRSHGLVYVDETVEDYRELRLPPNWRLHAEPEWGSIGASMRYCLRQYPRASRYGWLADDTVPRTPGWDTTLEKAAGDWALAYADDRFIARMGDYWRDQLMTGTELSAGLCWGGDLVRTVGWWCPPWLTQAGIDTTWTALIHELGLGRFVDGVVVEHKQWRSGKRQRDTGDDWTRPDVGHYVQADIDARDAWCSSGAFADALERIRKAMSTLVAA
jgi:hypothetical protein